MEIKNFTFSKVPDIYFGNGKIKELPSLINKIGKNILIITGSSSFLNSPYYKELIILLKEFNIKFFRVSLLGEPSPDFVDKITEQFRSENIEVVVAIGGGSVIDAGKAISAMLLQRGSVKQYLEGMETNKHNGSKVPFIAVPTSSGTGAEATKNAVLSNIGEAGFKSSLRHDNFVPDIAVLDPELTLTCSKEVTAACGLDALTQLIEAYVSTSSSPMTDALAFSGIQHFKEGFLNSFYQGDKDVKARGNMCYASLISGMVLANAGLGVVHGFASPIGGYFNIPHGVICGTLLAAATEENVKALLKDKNKNYIALEKYARIGALLSNKSSTSIDTDCEALIYSLKELIEVTGIPKLGTYGVLESDISKILLRTTNKNSPVKLDYEQLDYIIKSRI